MSLSVQDLGHVESVCEGREHHGHPCSQPGQARRDPRLMNMLMMTMIIMTMVKMLMMMTIFYLSTTAGASHDAKAKTPYTMPLLDLYL